MHHAGYVRSDRADAISIARANIGWKKKQKAIKEQTRNELELKDYEIIRSKKIRKWKEEHY